MSAATQLAGLLIAATPLSPAAAKEQPYSLPPCPVTKVQATLNIPLQQIGAFNYGELQSNPDYMIELHFKKDSSNTLEWASMNWIADDGYEATPVKTADIEQQDNFYRVVFTDSQGSSSDTLYADACLAVERSAQFIQKPAPQHAALTALKENLGIVLHEDSTGYFSCSIDNPHSILVRAHIPDGNFNGYTDEADTLQSMSLAILGRDSLNQLAQMRHFAIEYTEAGYELYRSTQEDPIPLTTRMAFEETRIGGLYPSPTTAISKAASFIRLK